MSTTSDARQVLDRDFLASRARLVDLAAALDRIDRAAGSVDDDPRMTQIRSALEILLDGRADRAVRMQMLFSLAYHPNWRREFGLDLSTAES
jgi:hypothetical protein